MPTFSSNTTLATNTTVPSGTMRPINTSIYIDTDAPTSDIGNNDVFNLSSGTIISSNTTLTLSPSVMYVAAPLSLRAGASASTAGGRLVLNSAIANTPIIGTPNNSGTDINNVSRPVIQLREGSQLIMPKSSVSTFAATHFQGSLSFDVRDSAIIGPINANSLERENNFYLDNTNSNLYLGHNSSFRDCQLIDFLRYELQDNFAEFSGVDIIYTNNTGTSGTGGTILSAARPDLHSFFDGLTTVTFLSDNQPDSFKYFCMNTGMCSHTFRASVPTNVYGFQSMFSSAGAGGNNSCYADICYDAPITIDMSCARSNGTVQQGDGRFVFWNADNEKIVDEMLTEGAFSTAQRYRWYSLAHRSFNPNRIGQGNILSSVAPVGWPDARTDTDAMHIIDSDNTNFATQTGVIFGTDTDATVETVVSTQEKYYRQATRRGWPFTQGYIQWECFPFFQANIGSTVALSGTGNPTKKQIDRAEAAADLIRSNHNIVSRVTQDDAINLTEAAAAALTGIAPTVTSSNELDLAITGANTTLRNLYNYTAKWALDNFADSDNYVYTMPTQPTTGYFPSSSASAVNSAPGFAGASEIGFSANTTNFNTSVADGAAWTDLQGIVLGSGRGILTENNTSFREMFQGVAIVWNSATRWALLEFFRERGLVSSGNRQAARITRVIASAGTIDLNATYHVGSSLNEYGTDVVRSEPIIDYLQTVELTPLLSNGAIMNVNRANLVLSGSGTFNSTDTQFNTINLDANSSLSMNQQTLEYHVTGTGEINSLPTGTTNAIGDGVTVGSGVSIMFDGGSTYRIAGDISDATLVRSGSGDVTLILVGTGTLPSTTPDNFVFQKEVTTAFTMPTGFTFDSEFLDSENVYNMVAYAGTSANNIRNIEPLGTIPTNALTTNIAAHDATPTLNQWQSGGYGGGNFSGNTNAPSSWAWDFATGSDRLRGMQLPGGGLSATELETIRDWLNEPGERLVLGRSLNSNINYAIYRVTDTDALIINGLLQVQLGDPIVSSGSIQGGQVQWTFGVDASGNNVTITTNTGLKLTNPTPVLSNSNRTATYTYQTATADNIFFGFGARADTDGQWFEIVKGDSTASNNVTFDLAAINTSIVPATFSSATGLAALQSDLNNNNAVIFPTNVVDENNVMIIEIANGAVPDGTSADGFYLHRSIQQQTNFLAAIAASNYAVNGWTYGTGQIIYNNQNVRWQKRVSSESSISFATPVINAGNTGIANAITTESVTSKIFWGARANLGVVDQATLEAALNGADIAKQTTLNSTRGQVIGQIIAK